MRLTPRMIRTIFRKDFVDAIRDGRVAIALIVPIALGIFYSYSFPDDTEIETPAYEIGYVAADETTLPDALTAVGGDNVELAFTRLDDPEALRADVADEDYDAGLVIPAGFDAALAAGEQPDLEVVQPPEATGGTSYLLAALDPALRALADQPTPAAITTNVTEATGTETIFERVGLSTYFVLFSLIFLVGMIAMLAIPVILAEEVEKKTFDALVMVASYWDVIVGKALVGVVYSVIAIMLTVTLAGKSPGDIVPFVASLTLLTVCLMGFGLWIGGLFRNANQINTWSGVILIPVVAPVFLIVLEDPAWVEWLVQLIPIGAAARVAANGLTGEAIFGNVALSYAVIVIWAVAGYALLYQQLRRRQA